MEHDPHSHNSNMSREKHSKETCISTNTVPDMMRLSSDIKVAVLQYIVVGPTPPYDEKTLREKLPLLTY